MLNQQWRKGLVAGVLGTLALLSACTFTVQPEGTMPEATPAPVEETGGSEATTMAEFVLPDGTLCLFSNTGTNVDFDGKRVNYTCEPPAATGGTTLDSTESTSQTLAILDEPVVAGPTEYFVDLATVAQTDGGFELHSSEVISFTAWEVVLADGRVCLHAGFGATMGSDGQRLNYTCDKGASTADEVGLMGELVSQGEGVWLAQIDEMASNASGFTQLSSTQVPVSRISGAEIVLGDESEAPAMTDNSDLVGPTWQWVQTVYGDDSVVVAADPSRYTLLFDPSGQVAATFDCNGGGGSYTVDESSLLFGAMISTLMACPENSQADVFAKDLSEVYSYVVEDGHLYLSLKLDSGIMEFAPAEEGTGTPEPTEEATVEPTEEATPEATEEATEEATPAATEESTAEPTEEPTEEATVEPTEEATPVATEEATPEATAEATEEATEEASAGAGDADLAGTVWQWEQSVHEGDVAVAVVEPSRYQIIFNADGTAGVLLDCNSGTGSYTVEGGSLTFGPITSTRMACPQDSQANEFAEDLAEVVSYAFADGNLHLTLSTDGVMEFSPVQ